MVLMVRHAHAQDFTNVDNVVKNYPKSFKTPDALAAKVTTDFTREDEKARALFTWIALNIQYNTNPAALGRKPVKYSYANEQERLAKIAVIENDLAVETLRNKKAVCHGYSMLFTLAARKAGLESEVIYGWAKSRPQDIGQLPGPGNHAWNVVKIGGKWKLVDVTWGAGGIFGNSRKFDFVFDDNYFFTTPDVFFLNHYPDDKQWLFTTKTEQDFAALPLYYNLGYQLISPDFGVLKTKETGVVPFKIKGIKATDEVAYQFSAGKFSKQVKPNIVNGVAEFGVLLDNTSKGILTIFVNHSSVAAYKIVR